MAKLDASDDKPNKMLRNDADVLVGSVTVIGGGFKYVPTAVAEKLLGADRFQLLKDDPIKSVGPVEFGGIYPWNVVDYLCLEQAVVAAKMLSR